MGRQRADIRQRMARMVSRKSNGFMLHRRTHGTRTGDNRGMDIQLNGEARQIADQASLAILLEHEARTISDEEAERPPAQPPAP